MHATRWSRFGVPYPQAPPERRCCIRSLKGSTSYIHDFRPTVSPLLSPTSSHNLLLLQSIPTNTPYRQGNVRRRKDDTRVGTAARRNVERLSCFPRRLHADGR